MTSEQAAPPIPTLIGTLPLWCSNCSATLDPISNTQQICRRCGKLTLQENGIWCTLSPDVPMSMERFVAEYEFIRASESRGSDDSAYYLALPYQDITGHLASQWKIRSATYCYIERNILTRMPKRPLHILDLGAGNGWLSYRLSLLGHHPVAVDLLTNDRDGLGAAVHYIQHLPNMFSRVQASLDQLPFPSATFDIAIFNASLHYSENYTKTLAEALRCIRPGGSLIIADSPWYRRESSGRAMVDEKHARFRNTYGFASDALDSQEFLTPQRLDELASTLGIRWQTFKPFYGLEWWLRPIRAKIQRRRTPSKFRIFVAEVPE